jgi:hypothetical protein
MIATSAESLQSSHPGGRKLKSASPAAAIEMVIVRNVVHEEGAGDDARALAEASSRRRYPPPPEGRPRCTRLARWR